MSLLVAYVDEQYFGHTYTIVKIKPLKMKTHAKTLTKNAIFRGIDCVENGKIALMPILRV